jgi:hypothetical protein
MWSSVQIDRRTKEQWLALSTRKAKINIASVGLCVTGRKFPTSGKFCCNTFVGVMLISFPMLATVCAFYVFLLGEIVSRRGTDGGFQTSKR